MSLHAAGEYVRLIDAIFGSTDTSRVLASFVHMCRREALDKNPEIRALIGEVGLFSFVSQVLKTIVAWICLQVVNHGRSRPYRLDLVYTNIRRGPEFCPRKFIDSNGKPLSRKASFARAPPEPLSPCTSALVASEISAASPQSTMHGKAQSDAAADAELSGNTSDICHMHDHVCAQTTLAVTGHESHSFSEAPESDSKFMMDASSGDEYDDDDNVYYALSDQDTPHRDPEWDQRLVEALRGLSVHLERQKQQKQKQQQQQQQQQQPKSDGKFDANNERAERVSDKCDQPDAASPRKDPNHTSQKQGPSVWERIAAVRAANARESQHTRQEQQHHFESTETSSACGSPSSPLLPASIQRGMGLPTFESAPASLVSSPQFSTTPNIIYPGEHSLHQAHTLPEDNDLCVSGLEHPIPDSSTNGKQMASDDQRDGCESIPKLDGVPPTDTPFVDSAQSPKESVWLQQEFPRKPLLFNLARFISLASSVYGKSFMQVLGLDHGMIDARALIDEYGDFEVQDQDPAAGTSRLSKAGSRASMSNEAGTSAGNASLLTTMPPRMGERKASTSKLPRAQPMSTYHTHAGYNPARPDSQRQYERRHFRTPTRTDPPSGGGRRTLGRRPPMRRNHHRRRPVTDHPNHYCFSQHSGIPLGDLLFSSYVSPIVPGVTRAADVKAAAVERKLRRKSSLAILQTQASQSSLQKGGMGGKPRASPESNGWIASIPIVGSIYQRLPSPTAAFSSIPVLPGLVSRVIGRSTATNKPKAEETARRSDQHHKQAVKPAGPKNTDEARKRFRRFEKIRQRLVYRNPSIHALVHYIAVDHATRSVVLACRGTLGISDLFIDMICEYETIRIPGHAAAARNSDEFRVHSGMWHSALLLADSSSE
ncbi:hypothetical protein GGI22_005392, partial [Coemansia erecta]